VEYSSSEYLGGLLKYVLQIHVIESMYLIRQHLGLTVGGNNAYADRIAHIATSEVDLVQRQILPTLRVQPTLAEPSTPRPRPHDSPTDHLTPSPSYISPQSSHAIGTTHPSIKTQRAPQTTASARVFSSGTMGCRGRPSWLLAGEFEDLM
jgi:hypothetical protein